MIIRLKVFIPCLVLIALIGGVLFFRLDIWVKQSVEDGLSAFTETKTEIDQLRISLSDSTIHIRKLQVASKDDEYKNAVEFEDILLGFELLPLLNKRVVVDHLNVQGIAWGT